MDIAKVARDYFLSSQSSLLIPNREYGSRKLIHVGIGRSNSAGSVLKLNSYSNINKNHHFEDEDYSSNRLKKASFLSNPREKRRSTSGKPEENGEPEYPWRTTGNADTAETSSQNSEAEYYSSPSLSTRSTTTAVGITGDVDNTNVSRETISRTRPASLSALSSSSSTSSLSPRPRPSGISSSGGLGTLKGLLGASAITSPGIKEKALAMKSASQESADMDVDFLDFRTSRKQTSPDLFLFSTFMSFVLKSI
ncbi:hypothetical protein PoB_005068300 [Plakobranchus ocellatus]|uniref:Uncharacterized protein n=1 Tax=Plakobranchus ocellatus TaxID=259542 RepID=A0AAV4BZE6_9GAST|nr:hypothetical protein PoB_005068300 [Plakobranchus ocellatus]